MKNLRKQCVTKKKPTKESKKLKKTWRLRHLQQKQKQKPSRSSHRH
jgi:hypothetical protein